MLRYCGMARARNTNKVRGFCVRPVRIIIIFGAV